MLGMFTFVLFNLGTQSDDVFHRGVEVPRMDPSDIHIHHCPWMEFFCRRTHVIVNLHVLIRTCAFSNLLKPEYLVQHVRLRLSGRFSNCSFSTTTSFLLVLSWCVPQALLAAVAACNSGWYSLEFQSFVLCPFCRGRRGSTLSSSCTQKRITSAASSCTLGGNTCGTSTCRVPPLPSSKKKKKKHCDNIEQCPTCSHHSVRSDNFFQNPRH